MSGSPAFVRGPAKRAVDPSSLVGAMEMAAVIRAAWRKAGVEIAVDIDSFGSGNGTIYSARVVQTVRAG